MRRVSVPLLSIIALCALKSVCCRPRTIHRSDTLSMKFNFNFLNPANSGWSTTKYYVMFEIYLRKLPSAVVVKLQLSKKSKPVVIPPKDFTIPTPKPLTVADGDYYGVISGAIALALRLGTGVFAVGWSPFGSKSSGTLYCREHAMLIITIVY